MGYSFFFNSPLQNFFPQNVIKQPKLAMAFVGSSQKNLSSKSNQTFYKLDFYYRLILISFILSEQGEYLSLDKYPAKWNIARRTTWRKSEFKKRVFQ